MRKWFTKKQRIEEADEPVYRSRMRFLKDCCPVCVTNKNEIGLSSIAYSNKYPAKYTLDLGHERIYLCEPHLKALRDTIVEYCNQEQI